MVAWSRNETWLPGDLGIDLGFMGGSVIRLNKIIGGSWYMPNYGWRHDYWVSVRRCANVSVLGVL